MTEEELSVHVIEPRPRSNGARFPAVAGVAVARRMRSGQSGEQAVAEMTEEELSVHVIEPRPRSNGARFPAVDPANGTEATSGAAPPDAAVDAEDATRPA